MRFFGAARKPIVKPECKTGYSRYRYQQGKIHINHNRFLGYTKDKDGNLVIVPEEAEIVKRIYREYLEGSSMLQDCEGLEG